MYPLIRRTHPHSPVRTEDLLYGILSRRNNHIATYSGLLAPAPAPCLARAARVPGEYTAEDRLSPAEYRALFRAAEDGWSGRLEWTDDELRSHFAREDGRGRRRELAGTSA